MSSSSLFSYGYVPAMINITDWMERAMGVRALYLAGANGWSIIDANKSMEEVE